MLWQRGYRLTITCRTRKLGERSKHFIPMTLTLSYTTVACGGLRVLYRYLSEFGVYSFVTEATLRGVQRFCPSTIVFSFALCPSSQITCSWRRNDGCVIFECASGVFCGVSRSIGDVYLKKPEISRGLGNPIPLTRSVISAEPSIIQRKLEPQDLFLIFASDGLWEQLSDQAAVEIVSKNPRAEIAKRRARAALEAAAKKRELSYGDIKKIKKGIRRHFHDDISVVVVYLDHKTRVESSVVGYTTAPKDIFSHNAKIKP